MTQRNRGLNLGRSPVKQKEIIPGSPGSAESFLRSGSPLRSREALEAAKSEMTEKERKWMQPVEVAKKEPLQQTTFVQKAKEEKIVAPIQPIEKPPESSIERYGSFYIIPYDLSVTEEAELLAPSVLTRSGKFKD